MLVFPDLRFRRMRTDRSLVRDEIVGGRLRRLVVGRRRRKCPSGYDRRGIGGRRGRVHLVGGIGGALHLADERLGCVLDVPDKLSGTAGNLGQLIGPEQQQGNRAGDGHVGNGEHAEGFFPKALKRTRPGKYDESFGRPIF